MAKLTGKELAKFAKSKKGTPYIYGCKGADGKVTQSRVNSLARSYPNIFTSTYLNKIKRKGLVGKVCTDCSGLISWYTGREIGSSQMYSSASARISISEWKRFPVGTVVWKSGHVGVYLGDGKVAEAKGIDYGTIISNIGDTAWKYGLLFSYITYEDTGVDPSKITSKSKNPYDEPSSLLRRGSRGEGVLWLQWELVQSGYSIDIDGVFGKFTEQALIAFQKSAKIEVDGVCGKETRGALKDDTGKKKK